jgi:pilus assembly protein Flp/PilA
MIEFPKKLLRDSRGATALEYGLILCLIVVVMVVGMTALGKETVSQWQYVSSQVASGTAQAHG